MRTVNPIDSKAMGHYMPGIISGNNLFVSGQLPIDPLTGSVVEGGVAAQTIRALRNMEKVLMGAGLSRDQVVMTHIYVTDMEHWDEVNKAYAGFFGGHKPARTVVVPAEKIHKGALVEVEAVAEMRSWYID